MSSNKRIKMSNDLQEIAKNLPTGIVAKILTFVVEDIWQLADMRTWNEAFCHRLVPWMIEEGSLSLRCTRPTQDMYLSELVGYNFQFIQFGPSSFDVWTPNYGRDPCFHKAMTILEGYETVEIRVLEAIVDQDFCGYLYNHNNIAGRYINTKKCCAEFFLECKEDAIDFYKEVHQIVNELAVTTDTDRLTELMEDYLGSDSGPYYPPIPPTNYVNDASDEEMEEQEEEENSEWDHHQTSCFHCLLTLRRKASSTPGCLQTRPDVSFDPGTRLLLAKDQSLAVSDGAVFVVPKIFSGWYHVAHTVADDTELLQVPMTIQIGPGGDSDGDYCLFSEMLDEGSNFSIESLKLAHVWNRYQTRPATDGVAIMDGAIPHDLLAMTVRLTRRLIEEKQVSLASHSIVVNPELYCCKPDNVNISPISELPCSFPKVKPIELLNEREKRLRDKDEHKKLLGYDSYFDEDLPGVTRDFWGRIYDITQQHIVLPSYFQIDQESRVSIMDDLADLSPRSNNEDFYRVLEDVFGRCVPFLESVYGYCRQIRQEVRTWEGSEMIEYEDHPQTLEVETRPLPGMMSFPCSLRDQKLQVVTHVETYSVSGAFASKWRLGGRPHEEIVGTAVIIVECGALNACHVEFKRAFHKREAHYTERNLGGAQGRPVHKDRLIQTGEQPAGRAVLRPGRLVVFPNTHLWKLEAKDDSGGERNQSYRLTLIRFELVNPEKRVVSMKECCELEQREPEERMKLHAEMCQLRNNIAPDFNVREVELYTD